MTTTKYNFDALSKANAARQKIFEKLFGRGLGLHTIVCGDYYRHDISENGITIGSLKISFAAPAYIEFDSGTSRHKAKLEKMAAEAVRAQGGTLAKIIEK